MNRSPQNAVMTEEEYLLVDHEVSMDRLLAVMRRLGASMTPEEFVREVSRAYYEVEAPRHVTEIHEYFHRSGAHDHFMRALAATVPELRFPVRILNLGCGAGYDLGCIRQVFPRHRVEEVVGMDISDDMMTRAEATADHYPCRLVRCRLNDVLAYGPYHLVVTHAMVHHVPNLACFFATIDRALPPGGFYVMGHEPNRRHWTTLANEPLLQHVHAAQKHRRRWRKLLQPSRYIGKLARMLGLAENQSLEAKVNRRLRERFGFFTDLTPKEIRRLVDVHVPDALPGDFRIGLDGFDWDELKATMLPNFELKSLVTYGYTLEAPGARYAPPDWRRLDAELARKYPFNGICYTALWQKYKS